MANSTTNEWPLLLLIFILDPNLQSSLSTSCDELLSLITLIHDALFYLFFVFFILFFCDLMMITMTRNPHLITLQILRFRIDVYVYIIPFDGIMEMPF
jgi:hypothetical protein